MYTLPVLRNQSSVWSIRLSVSLHSLLSSTRQVTIKAVVGRKLSSGSNTIAFGHLKSKP